MTISSANSRISYTGNGSTTAFSFPYEFQTGTDLRVYKNDVLQTITTHYTVSGGSGSSGTVTFVTAPANGDSVVIYDDPPATQVLDYIANDPFPAESHEGGLDKAVRLIRRLINRVDRAVRFADSYAGSTSPILATPAANKVIGWDQNGTAMTNYAASDFAAQIAAGSFSTQRFSGDGATTAFALSSQPASIDSLEVFLGGVRQVPSVDYTISASTLTFTTAPFTGTNNIFARWGTAAVLGYSNASAVNYIQTGASAVTRDLQKKAQETYSPQDSGASGDAAANDTTDVQETITQGGAVVFPKATGYKVTSLTIPASTYATGWGRQGPININGTGGLSITGSNAVLENMRISAPASAQIVYAGATATDVRLIALDLSSNATSAPDGHGVQVNTASSHRWKMIMSRLDVYNFGYLVNNTAGGSKGHIIGMNNITVVKGDAVEFNTYGTASEDYVVIGNVTEVTAGSGTGEGFGVGMAQVNGAAIVGNVSQRSWLAGDHVEDGSKNITFVGNIRKKCQDNGLDVYAGGAGSHQAEAKAITATGNHYEADSIIAGMGGIRIVNDASGTVYGSSLIANVLRNFESGLWLGGDATHYADGNVIDGCTYVVRCETGAATYTRIKGTNTVIGTATALLHVSSGVGAMVQAGKFVCSAKPTNIISKGAPGTTRPGCSVDGFSWPQTNTLTAGVTTWFDLFPAAATTNQFDGRITIQARNNAGIADNVWYSARVNWDGTTLTITTPILENNGGLALAGPPAVRVSGGMFQVGLFHASAVTCRIDVDFDGIYKV